jgi:RHS repeat-associated protein
MGQPGAKKGDEIVSVTPGDIHILIPPTGTPAPVPHPCKSVIDSNVATKVKVEGQPGAVKGSGSSHTPPHVPMGPGTFQKPPKNKGEIIMGSANVFYEGKEAAVLGGTANMCADPSDAPVGKVMGSAKTVLVGGGGVGSDEDRAAASAASLVAAKAASARILDTTQTGHPINVANGELVVCAEDFAVESVLPIQFVRTYLSSSSDRDGPLGHGWSHNFQESIEPIEPEHPEWSAVHAQFEQSGEPSPTGRYVVYRDTNGVATTYQAPPEGEPLVDAFRKRTLRIEAHAYTVTHKSGLETRFATRPQRAGVCYPAAVADRNGNATRFFYDSRGQLERVTDCYGRSLMFRYEHERLRALLFQPGPATAAQPWREFRYDTAGDLVEVVDRAGASVQHVYADHLMVQDRNRDGYSFFFRWDAERRCVETWGEDGYLTRYLSYDAVRRRTREINGEGEQKIYHYTPEGVVWKTETGPDVVVEVKYDGAGRFRSRSNGAGTLASMDYDDAGNVAALGDGIASTAAYEYNAFGQVIKSTNPLGAVEELAYDERGNLIERRLPGDAVVSYERDERGRVVRVRLPDGTAVETTYDAFGYPSVVDRRGSLTFSEYDALGQPLQIRRNNDAPYRYEWSLSGFPVRVHRGGELIAQFTYSAEGEVLERAGSDGAIDRFIVRCPGVLSEHSRWRRAESGDMMIARLRFETDSEGRPIRITDAHGRTATNRFDSSGRLHAQTAFDGASRSFTYTTAGTIAAIASDRGVQRFEHDPRGLTTRVVYSDDSEDSFEYDEIGRVVRAVNAWGAAEFEYDETGRPVVRRQGEFEIRSEIEPESGRLTSIWPDGIDAVLEEDERGAPRAITFGGRRIETDFDREGRLRRVSYPNGVALGYGYDEIGRLATVRTERSGRLEGERQLEYGPQGIAREIDSEAGERRFAYDSRGRLAAVHGAEPEFYRFDERENLVASHRYERSQSAGDQVLRAGERRFEYDADGRVVVISEPGGTLRLDHDAKGQLRRVALPDGGTVHYEYDALGRRVEKRFSGGARDGRSLRFFWDQQTLAKEEVWQADRLTEQRFHLFRRDEPLARIDVDESGEQRAYFFHNDHRGVPIQCRGEDGEIAWSSTSDSFGGNAEPAGDFQNIRLAGQYYDEETGLHYNRFRYYDPFTARYLEPDPIEQPFDASRYAYPTDPQQLCDPLGLTTAIVCADMRDPVLNGGTVQKASGPRQEEGSNVRLQRRYGPTAQPLVPPIGGPEKPLAGVDHLVINAHGTPNNIEVRIGDKVTTMNGKELAAHLKKQGFEGTKVTVVACQTGSETGTFAQDLADGLGEGTKVTAPHNYVGVADDGSLVQSLTCNENDVMEPMPMRRVTGEAIRAGPETRVGEGRIGVGRGEDVRPPAKAPAPTAGPGDVTGEHPVVAPTTVRSGAPVDDEPTLVTGPPDMSGNDKA